MGMGSQRLLSARSCYAAIFSGRVAMPGALQIWKSRAPASCKVFLWLAAKNRCWTADRLCWCGLQHLAVCPLCDQDDETLDHLLMGCVHSREVWASYLAWWDKLQWLPEHDIRFTAWLQEKHGRPGGDRDLWTGIALVCWCFWKHRNDVVFEGPDLRLLR
jgi:hypothetical protein